MDLRHAHLEAQGAVDEAHDAGPSTNVPKRSGAVRVPQTSRPLFPPLVPGIVKGAIVATPEQETPAEDALPRDSWMSIESRSSVVPSVLSRFSTLSALTRYSVRQSSIESPISAISELSPEQCKDNFGCDHRYCCTFCDLSFELKEEWKLHELESHDRHEVFSCGECQDVFTRAVSLEHHQRHEHSIEPSPDIPHQAKRVPIRSFWGCGFCAAPALFSSRPDYLEHVGKHYDEGRERSEWQHTLVITALLSQPKVKGAWDALVKEQELASGEKIRFAWDSGSTGRVGSDVREPSSLQDFLEFFATGPMGPQQVAELAFARAQKQVRADVGVSGAHSKDFRRDSEELKPVTTLPFSSENPSTLRDLRQDEDDENEVTPPIETPSLLISQPFLPHSHRPSSNQPSSQQPSPEQVSSKSAFFLHASTREMGRDSPSSKVLARIGQSTARSSSVPAAPSRADRRLDSGSSFQHRMKQGVLRRTDSDRNLATFNQNRDLGGDDIPRPQSQLSIRSRNVPSVAVEGSSGVNNADLITAASTGPQSSVRPHTSSSTLSSHDRDGSRWLDDSTSEAVSDDSLSDTDSWLEFDGQSVATKAWKVAFRGRVQEGMGLLWARYNGEFDTLIRQCVGGERSSGSPQFRESSGRTRRGTTSRHGHGHGKNLRPNGRYPEDDEDDEEDGEGHRPASSLSKRSSVSAKQFACPFRKHDPQKYSLQTHEVCAIRSWPTISRLKEHLYRRHYKVHCPRCKLTFNDARELADHEMYLQGCEVTNAPTPGDIDAWKERQLKSRRHNARRKTDEEKWREIYELLFPHEEIPSPYPEAAEDLVSVPSETHSSLDFQHFLLTQIPRLFTQTAEEHAGNYIQVHGSLPMDSIPEILESSLRKAFQAWEARGNELEAREASIASRSFLSNASPPLPYIFAQSTAAPVTAAYQTPPMSASVDQQFLLGNMTHNHMSTFSPSVTQANDSGFDETNFSGFSMAPGDYSGFVPQYNTDNWETGLGLMNSNNMTYDDNPHLINQFQGYHQG